MILGLTFSTLLAASALADTHADRHIRIGVVDHYAPFSSFGKTGKPEGFEIDIATALCRQMKVECRFIKQDWTNVIPALLARQFDAIFASLSITEERKKLIAFSQRYYRTTSTFAVTRSSNIRDTSPQAMKGRLIGVVSDTVQAAYLDRVYKPAGASIRHYSSVPEQQYDLVRGRIDAILMDKLAVDEWLQKTEQGACCARGGEIRDPAIIGEGIGIGLRKEAPALKAEFDAALDALLANGTYQRINDKYFPFSVY